MSKRRCLIVDDHLDTISAVSDALAYAGVETTVVGDITDAIAIVTNEVVALVLVDLRVPHNGTLRFHGGEEYIRDLKAGKFGDRNTKCQFAIMTAYPNDVDKSVQSLPGCLGVYSKAKAFVSALQLVLTDFWPDIVLMPGASVPTYIVDDMLEISRDPTSGDHVLVVSDAWNPREQFRVHREQLPVEVLEELEFEPSGIDVWAKINILAASSAEVCPHAFEIAISPDEFEAEFERPENA